MNPVLNLLMYFINYYLIIINSCYCINFIYHACNVLKSGGATDDINQASAKLKVNNT